MLEDTYNFTGNAKPLDIDEQGYINKYYRKMSDGLKDIVDINNSKLLCYRIYDKIESRYRDDLYYDSSYNNVKYCASIPKLRQLEVRSNFYYIESKEKFESREIKDCKLEILLLYSKQAEVLDIQERLRIKEDLNKLKKRLHKLELYIKNRFIVEHSIGLTTYDNELIFYGDLMCRHYNNEDLSFENLENICVSRNNFKLLEDLYKNYMFYKVVGNIHNELNRSLVIGNENSDWIYRN